MEEEKIISAPNEELIWVKLTEDFKFDPEPLEYHAVLEQGDRRILLDIINNHQIGFRAETFTIFSSYLFTRNNFRFAIHKEGFIDEIGKFLGMQDFVLGFKEFDDKFIIKTNNEEGMVTLFADPVIRQTLIDLPDLTFGIVEYTLEDTDGKAPFLELKINTAITHLDRLRQIYNIYFKVLEKLN